MSGAPICFPTGLCYTCTKRSVALLGLRTAVIAKLPANKLGTFLKNRIRFIGVSDDFLVYDESPEARLGLYYYEMGASGLSS